MKSLLLFLSLILPAAVYAGPRVVGNGGDAIICRQGGVISSAETLDAYEAKALRDLDINLNGSGLSYKELAKQGLERLKAIDPETANVLLQRLQDFEKEMILIQAPLEDIADTGAYIPVPSHCAIVQAAIQRVKQFESDKTFWINQAVWNLLTKEQKAILVMHELIYQDLIAKGVENSNSTRLLNSALFSGTINSLKAKEYFYLVPIEKRTTKFFTWMGLNFLVNVENLPEAYHLSFYNNGNLKTGHIFQSQIHLLGNDLPPVDANMRFFEDGKIESFKITYSYSPEDWKARYKTPQMDIALGTDSMEWYPSGKIRIVHAHATWVSPYRGFFFYKGQSLSPLNRAQIEFYENGMVSSIRGLTDPVKYGDLKLNGPNGNVYFGIVDLPHQGKSISCISNAFDDAVHFTKTGDFLSCNQITGN